MLICSATHSRQSYACLSDRAVAKSHTAPSPLQRVDTACCSLLQAQAPSIKYALPLLAAGVGLGKEDNSADGKDDEADSQGADASRAHLLDGGARGGNTFTCSILESVIKTQRCHSRLHRHPAEPAVLAEALLRLAAGWRQNSRHTSIGAPGSDRSREERGSVLKR